MGKSLGKAKAFRNLNEGEFLKCLDGSVGVVRQLLSVDKSQAEIVPFLYGYRVLVKTWLVRGWPCLLRLQARVQYSSVVLKVCGERPLLNY